MQITFIQTETRSGKDPVTYRTPKSVAHGLTELRAPVIKGDHERDFPYWSHFIDIDNNGGTVNYQYKQVQNRDGKVLLQLDQEVPVAWHFPIVVSDLSSFIDSDKRAKCKTLAVTKALANARKADVNLGMLVKERVATLAMIRDRSSRIINGARAIQQRDAAAFKKLKSAVQRRKFAQQAASNHLEAIFGWAPLFDEILGAVDHLSKPQYKQVLARGRHSVSEETTSNQSFNTAGSNGYVAYAVDRLRHTYSSRVTLKYTVNHKGLERAQRLGANASYLLYDSVPLSFITGWFSNLNHVIQAIDPLIGVTYFTGSASDRNLVKLTRDVFYDRGHLPSSGHSTYSRVGGGMGRLNGSSNHTRRSVYETEPKSEFVFYNNFSLYSVLASTSLVLQRKLKPLERVLKAKPFRYRGKRSRNLPPIPYIL